MAGSVFASLAQDRSARALPALSLRERVASEGFAWSGSVIYSGAPATGSQNTALGIFSLPSLTRAVYIDKIIVTSNKTAVLSLFYQSPLNASQIQHNFRCIVTPSAPLVLEVGAFVRPGDYIAAGSTSTTFANLNLRNMLDADGSGTVIEASMIGWSLYDDLNLAADKVVLRVGDSITNGTAGVTSKLTSYEWMSRQYLRSFGSNLRLVNKSISGSTSVAHERMRGYGDYDMPQVDLLEYSLGANDAAQGTSTATFKSNVAAMIAHKKALYPNAKMVVYGCSPLQVNAQETAAVALRTAAQQAVTEANDPKVLFCDLGDAFDRTVNGNYATSDGAGTGVHPSDAWHAAIYNVVKAFYDANNIRL